MALITLKAVGANGETPGCPVCTDCVWDLKSIEHPSRDECIQLLSDMISMNDVEICCSYFIPFRTTNLHLHEDFDRPYMPSFGNLA